jgi:hypothetical protein
MVETLPSLEVVPRGFLMWPLMDMVLLDCGLLEASRPVYKKGGGTARALLPFCAPQNPNILKLFARSPALLVPLHRRSSPRQANCMSPPTVRSNVVFFFVRCECAIGWIVVRGYHERFGGGGVTPGPHGGVRRFEDLLGSRARHATVGVFWEWSWTSSGGGRDSWAGGWDSCVRGIFIAGLRLPAHRFVAEVLQSYDVQIHQLTPNVVVALVKYVWAVTSYGGQPFVEVFAKNYCLHWQKRKIGSKIAQFGSCTFTPRTGKTSMEVVELVPCARNKWGNWYDYWFYVSGGEVEDLLGLSAAVMCS